MDQLTKATVSLHLDLKEIAVQPLPVIEEIWQCWENGKEGLLVFNRRAELGRDRFFRIQMIDDGGTEAFQHNLDSAVFDSTEDAGFKQLDELLEAARRSVLARVFPVTCSST